MRAARRGPPLVIGLTGGIGMGKSTASRIFRAERVPVFDADRAVHALGARGGAAVRPVQAAVPEAIREGAIDRARLRAAIEASPVLLGAIEAIFHPLVRAMRDRVVARCRRARLPLVVLDVPLLLETGGDRSCDLVVVVSAPAAVQTSRIRRRRAMSGSEAARLIGRQMPDREKRRRADVVIPTGLSRAESARRLRLLVQRLRNRAAFIKGSSHIRRVPRQ